MSLAVEKLSRRNGQGWHFRDISFYAETGKVVGIFGDSANTLTALLGSIAGETKTNGKVSPSGAITYLPTESLASRDRTGFIHRLFAKRSVHETHLIRTLEELEGVVCLSEPFVFLDEDRRIELTEAIRRLTREKGLTIIISTCDFRSILETCDRTACILDGYLVREATPQEVYDHPESTRVAKLTGRVNLIEARRLSSSKASVPEFVSISGNHRLFAAKADLRVLGAIHKNIFLAIRPEQIEISFGASFPADNILKARIETVLPRGQNVLVSLASDGINLVASVPKLIGIGVGDECMVSLPPDRLRILNS